VRPLKILILSFYFFPDLSAGSFRTTALAKALKRQFKELELHIVTTQPNRYQSFEAHAESEEYAEGVSISRISLPRHRSGRLDQARAFFCFARGAYRIASRDKYDLVFATSSRLMTAALGALIARNRNTRLYLDLRDIFVDTISDVLRFPLSITITPFFRAIEHWSISRAEKVNLVSEGFRGYFEIRYPNQAFSYFTNGIDAQFFKPPKASGKEQHTQLPLIALYAGNIGDGQALDRVLPLLARRTDGRITFKIIGDGGRREQLILALQKACVRNVEILKPIARDALIDEYRRADILFLHLDKLPAFEKVLPSKIFEYGALGEPIWAGVSGFSAEFIGRELDNAVTFPPCDAEAALIALSRLRLEDCSRTNFLMKYSRDHISDAMARDIMSVMNG